MGVFGCRGPLWDRIGFTARADFISQTGWGPLTCAPPRLRVDSASLLSSASRAHRPQAPAAERPHPVLLPWALAPPSGTMFNFRGADALGRGRRLVRWAR